MTGRSLQQCLLFAAAYEILDQNAADIVEIENFFLQWKQKLPTAKYKIEFDKLLSLLVELWWIAIWNEKKIILPVLGLQNNFKH